MKFKTVFGTLAFAGSLLLITLSAAAQSGSPDTNFGTGGLASVGTISGSVRDAALQTDGKIVVLLETQGTAELARFNADGTPDAGFGGGDAVATRFWAADGGRYGTPRAMALQMDDGFQKIIVAGWTYKQVKRSLVPALRVDRFMPDGTVDMNFGTNGSFVYQTGYANAVAVQPDGKIVTIGGDATGPRSLVRLHPDGGLDNSFGTGGIVDTLNILGGEALEIQADSLGQVVKIIAAGAKTLSGKGNKVHMAVARFNPDGSLDASFASGGRAMIDFYGTSARANQVRVDSQGRIVAAGDAQEVDSTARDIAVARLDQSGQLDANFDFDGKVTYDFEAASESGTGLVLQSDGMVVVGGYTSWSGTGARFTMVRFDSAGNLDAAFGSAGAVVSNFPGMNQGYGRRILLQKECGETGCVEKIIIAGNGRFDEAPLWRAAAARYIP